MNQIKLVLYNLITDYRKNIRVFGYVMLCYVTGKVFSDVAKRHSATYEPPKRRELFTQCESVPSEKT